jgi:large subunit ribosomal protein L21
MEVEAAPVVLGRHQDTEDTLEVTTAEVAAEGPLNHDDLTKIEGIGPKISAILIAAGISTFSRLATTPEEELRDILKRAGLRLAPTLDTWAQQAAVAARGAWDELTALQEKIGRAPDHPRDDENKKTGEE